MVPEFGNLKTESGLTKLDEFMRTHSYVTGYSPTQDDCLVMEKLQGIPNFTKFPCASRWMKHVSCYSPSERNWWPKGNMNATKVNTSADDDFDLFGEMTDADKEAAKKLANSKKEENEGKKKKQVINKSSLVIEVKPADASTNLDEVAKLVKKIDIEGVTWGEATKKVPIAFGLYKLQVGCVILDDVVNTNEITDRIEALGMTEEQAEKFREKMEGGGDEDEEEDEESCGFVQSAEIVSFNKL